VATEHQVPLEPYRQASILEDDEDIPIPLSLMGWLYPLISALRVAARKGQVLQSYIPCVLPFPPLKLPEAYEPLDTPQSSAADTQASPSLGALGMALLFTEKKRGRKKWSRVLQ